MNEFIDIDGLQSREFVDIKTLSNYTGLSSNTIHNYSKDGKFHKIYFKGKCWFRTDQILEYLSSLKVIQKYPVKNYEIDIDIEEMM